MILMEGHKHSQTFASAISECHQSQFSRLLTNHRDLAKMTLDQLSRAAAKSMEMLRKPIAHGSGWTIGILIDATLHPRSSLYVHNSQRFNHGQGFVVGHQWTNIVLYINGRVIPLPPIPFWSKNECKKRNVPYLTEHERIKNYLDSLNLHEYVGIYEAREVVVMSDSGYDNKNLQKAVLDLGWDFLGALKSVRGTNPSLSIRLLMV
jgi:hypothetical protein